MADATLATLRVIVKAEVGKYNQQMRAVNDGLKKQTSLIDGLTKRLLSLYAAKQIIRGMWNLTKYVMDQEIQFKKLESVLKATGGAAGLTINQLDEMATRLQRTTTFTRQQVLEAQTLAATFIEIKDLQFEPVIQGILDLSQAMGTGLRQAALQLSKVLNNPIQLLGALRRSGVSFNETQGKAIKEMWRMGDAVGAQTEILRILREQGLDKTAQAMRQTMGGSIKGLIEDLGQLYVSMTKTVDGAGLFTDVFNKAASAVQEFDDKIKALTKLGFFDMIAITAKASVDKFVSYFKTGFLTLQNEIISLGKFVKGFWDIWNAGGTNLDQMLSGKNEELNKLAKDLQDARTAIFEKGSKEIIEIERKKNEAIRNSLLNRMKDAIDANKKIKSTAREAATAVKALFKISSSEDKLKLAQEMLSKEFKAVESGAKAASSQPETVSGGGRDRFAARVNSAAAYIKGGGKLSTGPTSGLMGIAGEAIKLLDLSNKHLSNIDKATKNPIPVVS